MIKKEIKRVTPALILGILAVYLILSTILQGASHPDLIPLFNIVLVAGLVAVTAFYAYFTLKMAEEMREQRYDAVRPVIDIINIEQTPSELANQAYANKPPDELRCKLCNVGFGPAIDVYSFVQPPSHERRRHDFHTITIGKEKSERLSLEQKDDRWFLVAYYKDVYGRCFESSREVRVGSVNPDPLQFREIACKELPK